MKLIDEVEQLASEFERTMPNLSLSLDQLAMGREALYAMKLIDEVEQLAFAFERTMPNVIAGAALEWSGRRYTQ